MTPTKADYAKINIACKELGLDKYQLLFDRYGLESSKQLTRFQLSDLYDHFKSLNWTPKRTKKAVVYPEPVQRKVQALWITLAKACVIRNGSDRSMNVFVEGQTEIANLRWVKEQHHFDILIKALKEMGKREGIELG